MKKTLIFLLILCFLLSGCASTAEPTAPSDTDERLAYYETAVSSLQKELLDLKAALYVSRAEYAELEEMMRRLEEERSLAEEHFCYVIENGAAILTAYGGRASTVEIPTTLGGCPVRAIADRAFAGNTHVTSVTLPEGIERVGWFAFSGCVMLEAIDLPASITAIDYGAFEHCKSTLTVTCKDGSYACLWAQSYGLRIQKT